MKKTRRIFDIQSSYEKGIKNVFQVTSYFVLLGNVFDILKYSDENNFIVWLNLGNIAFIIPVLILYYLKKMNYKYCFSIVIYSIYFNILTGKFINAFDFSDPMRVNFYLRDSVFVILLLTLASFSLHKLHAFIIGGSFILFSIIFTAIVKSVFLNESVILYTIIIASYMGLTYYLVSIFEKAMTDQHEKSQVISKQNENMYEINAMLEERQQLIEEQSQAIEAQSQRLQFQSEELKEKNRELAKLNTSKDMFISILAHDLKNPFNIVMGFSELFINKYHSLTDEKRINYAQNIRSTTIKIYYLLENLLSWTKSQSDKITLKPEQVSLNNLVNDVIELYGSVFGEKMIVLEFKPGKNYNIFADKDMISSVLRNLISNALKFTPKNGNVVISLGETENSVEFTITDSGIGMEEKEISDIFDVNKHSSARGTDGEPGTGLGLKLCKIFIEKNNGQINVSSRKNEGTTFTISIPKVNSIVTAH